MLLALNIGNTNITFGGYTAHDKLMFTARLYADPALSSDELTYKIVNMLSLYEVKPARIDAVIFSSVVPALSHRMREALHKMTDAPIMEVGPGLKSGVRIRLDNPAQLGGELLCAVVGAQQLCSQPFVVLNFDTAITMLAVDSEGSITGGAILPAPQLSLRALLQNTAQLQQVDLVRPRHVLGANTNECLQSGMVYGTAAMLDGMMNRFCEALKVSSCPVVATGTLPPSIRTACTHEIVYRESLILDGLHEIWKKNKK